MMFCLIRLNKQQIVNNKSYLFSKKTEIKSEGFKIIEKGNIINLMGKLITIIINEKFHINYIFNL